MATPSQSALHSVRLPGESEPYRAARNELLLAEAALRKQIEAVAALRRKLPLGGALKQDYVFEEGAPDVDDSIVTKTVRIPELFEPGKDALLMYSFMYGPEMASACTACTSILDGLNGSAPHFMNRLNFVIVAK